MMTTTALREFMKTATYDLLLETWKKGEGGIIVHFSQKNQTANTVESGPDKELL